MNEHEQKKDSAAPVSGMPKEITLTPTTTVDLTELPESKRAELVAEYIKGRLDISKKAQELHVDIEALKKTLDDLVSTTRRVSDAGDAITVSHTSTSSAGRTEVIMGNTEKAHSGKLTKSQTGEKDWTPYYIFGGIFALIIIAALVS